MGTFELALGTCARLCGTVSELRVVVSYYALVDWVPDYGKETHAMHTVAMFPEGPLGNDTRSLIKLAGTLHPNTLFTARRSLTFRALSS